MDQITKAYGELVKASSQLLAIIENPRDYEAADYDEAVMALRAATPTQPQPQPDVWPDGPF